MSNGLWDKKKKIESNLLVMRTNEGEIEKKTH